MPSPYGYTYFICFTLFPNAKRGYVQVQSEPETYIDIPQNKKKKVP